MSKALTNVVLLNALRTAALNIEEFGAVADGVTDSSAAFTAAHNALGATGGAIYIPAGNYVVNSAVNFTKPVFMYGDGAPVSVGISKISCTTPSITLFTTSNYLACENFSVTAQTTNTIFKQVNTASNHAQTAFRNVAVLNCFRFFESQASLVFAIDGCWIGGFTDAAVYINNGPGTSEDQGDSFIRGNSFLSGGPSSKSIHFVRGAGFWVSGNKFNAAAGAYHVLVDVTSPDNTGNFLIENNSFEGQVTGAIRLAGTASNTKIIISQNQFSGGVAKTIDVSSAFEVIIANNTINGLTSTPISPETGIYVASGPFDVTIQGNNFHKIDKCIELDTSSAKILDNTFGLDCAKYVTGTIISALNSQQSYSRHYLSRFVQNTSNSVWATIFKITGQAVTLDIMIDGFMQGVGAFTAYYKTFNGTNIVTPVTAGTGASHFDFQITANGEIQFKINGATGTNAQVNARINVMGGINNVTFS